eukprot:2291590-Amphidinium_carterae.1
MQVRKQVDHGNGSEGVARHFSSDGQYVPSSEPRRCTSDKPLRTNKLNCPNTQTVSPSGAS